MTVRVYIPADVSSLRAVLEGQPLNVRSAWAATSELLETYGIAPDDEEMGETIAMALAAAASRLSNPDLHAPRRVVIALDADEVVPSMDDDNGQAGLVHVEGQVTLADVVSLHMDAGPYAAPAADELDDVMQLQWFDISELDHILTTLAVEQETEGN